MGQMHSGRSGYKIGAGLTAECIDIGAQKVNDEYQFIFTRAAINSPVLAQIRCINTTIGMCTCKKNVFTVKERSYNETIPIHNWKSKHTPSSGFKILHSELINH